MKTGWTIVLPKEITQEERDKFKRMLQDSGMVRGWLVWRLIREWMKRVEGNDGLA